jgi:probable F420-dependent oxidoreductase
MAEVTDRAMLGVLVTCTGYRNPHLLADMARTVDHASGGRLILGLGAGWYERDYREYGYPFGATVGRLQEFDRALYAIKERLAKLNPGPVRGSIPVLIGAGGERIALRIVAEHADIWNHIGDPELMAKKARVLDGWCDRVGRNADDIKRSALMIDPRLVERADDYLEAGVTDLLVAVRAPDHDLTPLERLLEWRDGVLRCWP